MSERKKKIKKLNPSTNKNQTLLSPLLDFFSDCGLSYISAFVACIFGVYTIFSILQDTGALAFICLSIVYWLLFASGLYCLLNFTYFIRIANKIKRDIVSHTKYAGDFETIFEEKYIETSKTKGNRLWRKTWGTFFRIKDGHALQLASIVYILAILIPWILALVNVCQNIQVVSTQ